MALIILYDLENNLLLQHRTKDAAVLPDYWAFFGGGIKEGETPEDAVRREAFEELNYELKFPQLFIEQDFKINDAEGHMYIFIEAFNAYKSELKLQEGQGWGWFRDDEIDSLEMVFRDRCIIKSLGLFIDKISWCQEKLAIFRVSKKEKDQRAGPRWWRS